MPLNYDQITATTQKHYIPRLIDNIFDSDILLNRSKEKGWYTSVDGGTEIVQPLLYALNGAGGSYGPSDTLDTTDNDTMTAASYQWRFYYGNISILRADELKNSGMAKVLDFVKQKTQIAEMTLKDNLGDGLYSTGSGANDIGGLRLCIDTANTVGGIPQSAYSWFRSQENSSTTTVSISGLNSMYTTLSINNNTPTLSVTTRTLFNSFYALLQPQQRFVDASVAKAGFSSLMLNGMPVVVGSKCPASHWFMLNEKFMNLYYHKDENFRFEPFVKPANQNAKSGKVYWAGNFGISNARMHGKFTALAS